MIDDTADADASNTHGKTDQVKPKVKLDIKDAAFEKAKSFIETGGSLESIKSKYDLTTVAESILSKL